MKVWLAIKDKEEGRLERNVARMGSIKKSEKEKYKTLSRRRCKAGEEEERRGKNTK